TLTRPAGKAAEQRIGQPGSRRGSVGIVAVGRGREARSPFPQRVAAGARPDHHMKLGVYLLARATASPKVDPDAKTNAGTIGPGRSPDTHVDGGTAAAAAV